MLPLLAALPAYLAAALLWTFGAVLAFTYSPLALPLIEPLLAGMVSLGATTGFRFLVADKDRRFLRRSFALYLAPSVIEKMVTANKPPALGGEMRNVTIFFSDLAGFSSISEALTSMHWHVGGAAILPAASRRSRRSPPPIRRRRSCCAGPRNFWRIRRRPIGTPSTRWKGSDGVNRTDASPAHFPAKAGIQQNLSLLGPRLCGTSG